MFNFVEPALPSRRMSRHWDAKVRNNPAVARLFSVPLEDSRKCSIRGSR